MTGAIDNLIQYRINRAFETLREAETMIEHQFWNASINRVYYACFYAVSALLLKKGVDSSTHKGLRQELYQKNMESSSLTCLIEDKQETMMIS